MMKKFMALLLIFLVSTTSSFAIKSSEDNVEQMKEAENTMDLENYLNVNYKENIIEGKTLEFTYELREFQDNLRVKMRGQRLSKDSLKPNEMNSYIKKLLETLVKEIKKSLDKNISFYIYDNDDNVIAKYKYYSSSQKIVQIYNDLKDYNVYDLENDLNSTYAKYGEGENELEFEYESDNTASYIDISIEGQNFNHYDIGWKDRDVKDFRNFVRGIAEEVIEEFSKDVRIDIYSKSRKERLLAKYEYSENQGDFIEINEDGKKIELDKIESLNDESPQDDGTYIYLNGRYDLRFKVSIKKSKDTTTIDLRGQNFDKDSYKWFDRDKNDFDVFVLRTVKGLNDGSSKYVNVIAYDEEKDITGKYIYYPGKDRLYIEFEESYNKDDLNYYYGNYSDENVSLKFNYRLKKESTDNVLGISENKTYNISSISSKYMKVSMHCEDFHLNKWNEREKEVFEDFLEMIAEEVSRAFDLYVLIIIDDGNGEFRRYGYGEVSDGMLAPYDDYKGSLEELEKPD